MSLYGTSPYLPADGKLVGAAEFYDFAPTMCVCCGCCVSDAQRKRTYFRVYDGHIQMNQAISPCCCLCDDEMCLSDRITTLPYDKPPGRVGMCCYCIPCTCCGPPVMFAHKPMCLCCSLEECYGTQLKIAPCNCFGCKCCLCCGNPCYTCCSAPLVGGLKNTEELLKHLANATNKYYETTGLAKSEMVVLNAVSNNIGTFGATKKVQPDGGAPPKSSTMER